MFLDWHESYWWNIHGTNTIYRVNIIVIKMAIDFIMEAQNRNTPTFV